MSFRRGGVVAALLVGICALTWSPLEAQACPPGERNCRPGPVASEPHGAWQDHALVLGINSALGGLTAGIRQRARGGSFWRGFAMGAAGGSVIYAGKWLSTEDFWGAGLAGRQVAAVGASVVRNASEGRDPLEHLMLPLGPVRFYVDRATGWKTQAKLDLAGSGVLVYRALSRNTRIDASASISAGTPVFMTDTARDPTWHGNTAAGVILLRDHDPQETGAPFTREAVFAHERVHLLQYDQALHTWSAPAEAWLLRRIAGGGWISRHVDIGLVVVPLLLVQFQIPYEDRPWEREAHFFSGSR